MIDHFSISKPLPGLPNNLKFHSGAFIKSCNNLVKYSIKHKNLLLAEKLLFKFADSCPSILTTSAPANSFLPLIKSYANSKNPSVFSILDKMEKMDIQLDHGVLSPLFSMNIKKVTASTLLMLKTKNCMETLATRNIRFQHERKKRKKLNNSSRSFLVSESSSYKKLGLRLNKFPIESLTSEQVFTSIINVISSNNWNYSSMFTRHVFLLSFINRIQVEKLSENSFNLLIRLMIDLKMYQKIISLCLIHSTKKLHNKTLRHLFSKLYVRKMEIQEKKDILKHFIPNNPVKSLIPSLLQILSITGNKEKIISIYQSHPSLIPQVFNALMNCKSDLQVPDYTLALSILKNHTNPSQVLFNNLILKSKTRDEFKSNLDLLIRVAKLNENLDVDVLESIIFGFDQESQGIDDRKQNAAVVSRAYKEAFYRTLKEDDGIPRELEEFLESPEFKEMAI